jgi:hypothetical protein
MRCAARIQSRRRSFHRGQSHRVAAMRAACAATTTALAFGTYGKHCMSHACALSVTFCFCFCFCGSERCCVSQAARGRSGLCVACLRPAEIWGDIDVWLKRRYITGSHVAHVTGSEWPRLLGALAHDMTRCQLDAEACVGGRL